MSTDTKKEHVANRGMQTYSFTLVLSGQLDITDELENALFEAGCDDALLAFQNGELFLDFDREAISYAEALLTAVRDVEQTQLVEVAAVRPEGYSTIERLNLLLKARKELPLKPELKSAFDEALSEVISRDTGNDSTPKL